MGPTSRQRKPDSEPGGYCPAGLIGWAKIAKPSQASRHSEVRKTSQRRRPTMLLLGGLAGCRPKNHSTTGRGQIETRRDESAIAIGRPFTSSALQFAQRRTVDVHGVAVMPHTAQQRVQDRKSTRLNSSHRCISYAVFCLKKY